MAATEARKETKRSTRFSEDDQDPKQKRIKRNFMNETLLTETFKSRAAECVIEVRLGLSQVKRPCNPTLMK